MARDAKAKYILEAEDRTKLAIKKAKASFDNFGGTISKVSGLLTGLGSVAFVAMAKRSLDMADAIGKASERTGFAVETLQELRFAADQTGVGITALEGGLARFTKRLGLARMGTGAASETYKKLGTDLNRTNKEVFRDVVDTLAAMDDQTNRLALTTRLFGDDAQALELTFRGGTDALDAYAEKAQNLGLVLSEDLVRGAEEANDQLSIMKQVLDVQFTRAFVELAPEITAVGQAFADAAPKIAAFISGFGGVESQGRLALSKTIEDVTKQLESQRGRLADVLRQKETGRADSLLSVFFGLEDEEELRQDIARLESKLQKASERLLELNGQYFVQQEEAAAQSIKRQESIAGLFQEKASGTTAAIKKIKPAIDDMMGPYLEWQALQKESIRLFSDTRTPMEEFAATIERIGLLFNRGFIDQDTANRAVQQASETMQALTQESEEMLGEINQFAVEAARSIQSSFADFLFDPFEGGLKGLLGNFTDTLRRMAAEAASQQILTSLFGYGASQGGGIGEFFGSLMAGVQHSGGIAGTGTSRSVPALAFAGAPRLHSGGIAGMAANEVPTILQRGEGVFTKEQMAAMGNTTVNQTNNFTLSGQVDRRTQQQIAANIGSATARAMRRNT